MAIRHVLSSTRPSSCILLQRGENMADLTFAERAEAFYSELMREQYQVGAGLKPELDLAPIYEKYADLFAEPAVRERVAAMQQMPIPATGQDAGMLPLNAAQIRSAKEAHHLADFAVSSHIENAAKELTQAITNAELHATVEWREKQIPYQNIRSVLVREPDYSRRHDLESRQLAVTVKQNPLRVERLKVQHDLARRFGFPGYRGMVEQLRGWDLRILAKALDPLVKETDDVFEDKLERNLAEARVPRDKANTSDIAFVMRAPAFDAFFPADRLIPAFKRTVEGMGLALDTTPGLHVDAEARPLKSPRAFCAPVRIPSEVYLVIKPIGGQDDYRALFHESGHAEHFTHIDADLPFALRYLGEEAISETFAFLFEHVTLTPRWLVDVVRVPLRDAERYQRFGLFNKLWLLRRYTAKLRYELELHEQGPSGMDTAYRDILQDVLHVNIPPERYLDDVDDAFYVAGYLRAWIFERQLAQYLLDRFGEGWYESIEAGKFLRSMWAAGLADPVDEMARTRIGAKGLDPMPLIQELADF